MKNQNTNTMKDYEIKAADRAAQSQELCNTPIDKFREEVDNAIVGLSEKEQEQYFSDRASEFYDKYNFDAEPSETANILTEVFQRAVDLELHVWLAQKEQYMRYMGSHPAHTFTYSKPSDLLKEFGEWLISVAEHADYDYMEASDFED